MAPQGSALRKQQTRQEEQDVQKPIRGAAHPAGMELVGGDDDEDEEQGESENQQVEQRAAEPPRRLAAVQQPGAATRTAIARAQEESQTIGGLPNPSNTTQARRVIAQRAPLFDVTKMSPDEMRQKLSELLEQQQRGGNIAITKAIRFNNGAEPNVQAGEVVSARDSGSISVYGFARRPLTLYAGQWMQLAHYLPDILEFIETNLDEINGYVQSRLGNKSKSISKSDLEDALRLFCVNQESGGAAEAE